MIVRRAHRKHGMFQHVPPDEIDLLDREWLEPIGQVKKSNFDDMMKKVHDGQWDLWRITGKGQGVGVTFPYEGRLFVYYLHGRDFFDKLTMDELLLLSRGERLNGMLCETKRRGLMRLYTRVGWRVYHQNADGWLLELNDG